MDSVFFLDEEARARFLLSLVQSVGCTYVCLWYNNPPSSNYLIFMDGLYNDQNNQPSSSVGSSARRYFDDYCQNPCCIDNGYVPGLAFKEGLPYLELEELELLSRVSTEPQRQFYQEAMIKAAAFIGCRNGEIEIGYSIPAEDNVEMEMKRRSLNEFHLQSQLQHGESHRSQEQNRPSSSSSSLRSLSMASPSPEYSSLLFNIPSTSNLPVSLEEALPVEKPTRPTSSIRIQPPQQQQQNMQPPHHGLHHLLPFQIPDKDIDAAMTRAILAVISSPSTSSSSSYQTQQNPFFNYQVHNQSSAFKSYHPALAPKIHTKSTSLKRQNMLKRALSFLNKVRAKTLQEQMQGTRTNPPSTQLTHMISERKRREKLNESFQALRSLLPPGFKKDKASVLSSTKDYLQTLKAEISELKQKNQLLELQQFSSSEREARKEVSESTCSSTERVNIQVNQAAESKSEGQGIELRVCVRGDCKMWDLIIRILEFLKKVDMSLDSVEADTQMQQTIPLNRIIIRLNTKGNEWDKSAFEEAIARIVADVTR